MNSGEVGQEKLNAKDLTAEIDRATDLTAPELSESKARALGRAEASTLGSRVLNNGVEQTGSLSGEVLTYNPDQENTQVLTYNPEQAEKVAVDTERVRTVAEVDNGYGEAVKSGNESLVGFHTKILTKEYINDDEDVIRTENGENGPYAKGIMENILRDSTEKAIALASSVKATADSNIDLSDFDQEVFKLKIDALKGVNRIFGGRN